MKDRLPWLLLVVSVALNAFFVGGYVNARLSAEQVETPRGRISAVASQLNLSPEQHQAFRAMTERRREARRRLYREGAALSGAYWDELTSAAPDDARLAELGEQRLERRRAYQAESTALMRAFVERLTPEQRRQFAAFMKRRLKWRGKHSWRHPRLSLRNSSALEAGRPFLVEGGHAFAEVLGQLTEGVLVGVHEAGHLIEGA